MISRSELLFVTRRRRCEIQVSDRSRDVAVPDAVIDFNIDRSLAGKRDRQGLVDDRWHLSRGFGALCIGGDFPENVEVRLVAADRVRIQHPEIPLPRKVEAARAAIDDHHSTALGIGAADGVDQAQNADTARYCNGAEAAHSRVAVRGITGFQIAAIDDQRYAGTAEFAQETFPGGAWDAEHGFDLVLVQPPQDVFRYLDGFCRLDCRRYQRASNGSWRAPRPRQLRTPEEPVYG